MMPVTWPPWSMTDIGDRAHQADRAAAIDQADVVLGQDAAEGAGGFDEFRIAAGAGAAIDANGFDVCSFDCMWPGRRGASRRRAAAAWQIRLQMPRQWETFVQGLVAIWKNSI